MSAYKGLRIADFSQGVAGPMAAMLLGDFEAEVVKIEPPGGDRLQGHVPATRPSTATSRW